MSASQLNVTGEVEIVNEDGWNTNQFVNAFLSDYLTLTKTAGASESYLDIEGTTIVGPVTVDKLQRRAQVPATARRRSSETAISRMT